MENEDNFAVIESENECHIFLHGEITSDIAFKMCTTLTSIALSVKEKNKEKPFGFSNKNVSEQELLNENTITTETIDAAVPELIAPCDKFQVIIHLNSPGGSIQSALMIADTIDSIISDKEILFSCIGESMIASAGVIIFLACPKRTMGHTCKIYLRETMHSINGANYSDLALIKQDSDELTNSIINFYHYNLNHERIDAPYNISKFEKENISKKQIKNFFKTSKTLSIMEAIDYGFVTHYKLRC